MTTEEKPYKVPVVNFGRTGLKVSKICFGAMSFGPADDSLGPFWSWTQKKETVLPIFKRAYEAGINFFDTANMYSNGQSEQILGECIRELKIPRENVVIATKFAFGPADTNSSGRSRKHIIEACEKSLKNLGVSYIDLYIVHGWSDTKTPLEETMRALNDLVVAGKILYIGTSNMYAWQLIQANSIAEKHGWTSFISVQNQYNLIARDDEVEMVPAAKFNGIALTPWSPLAGGFLTGKRKKGEKGETIRSQTVQEMLTVLHPRDCDWPIIDRLTELATKKGVSAPQIALAWLLTKSDVTSPIIGATKLSHLEDAISATKVQLSPEDITFLEELYVFRGGLAFNNKW